MGSTFSSGRRLGAHSADYSQASTSSTDPFIDREWVLTVHSSDLDWRTAGFYVKEDCIALVSGTRMLDLPFTFIVEIVHRQKSEIVAIVRRIGQPIELKMPAGEEDAYEFKRWLLDRLLNNVAFITRDD